MAKDIRCFRCGRKLGEVVEKTIIAKHSIRHGKAVECRARGEMGFICSSASCNFSGWYISGRGWVQSNTN